MGHLGTCDMVFPHVAIQFCYINKALLFIRTVFQVENSHYVV